MTGVSGSPSQAKATRTVALPGPLTAAFRIKLPSDGHRNRAVTVTVTVTVMSPSLARSQPRYCGCGAGDTGIIESG